MNDFTRLRPRRTERERERERENERERTREREIGRQRQRKRETMERRSSTACLKPVNPTTCKAEK